MTTRIANVAAIAACNAIVDGVDAGAGSPNSGRVEIRSGALPSPVDGAPSGTVLALFTLPNPAFGNAADTNPGARATANAIAETVGLAAGSAGHFLVLDGAGEIQWGGDCGTGSEAMVLNTTSIVVGAAVQITSWVFNMPES